ncbi:MAG: tetratricopeptide repeat protein [Idiomarina sp.]|nr:tetratricopeptide repeat protein [Idiomarina sp.]
MIEFHIIRPYALFALVPILALLPWWWSWVKRPQGAGRVIAPHLLNALTAERDTTQYQPRPLWLLLAWVIATLALAGPTWIKIETPVLNVQSGRVILMDMSQLTRATDITPDRHTRLKFKAQDLVQSLTDGQTGLVAYAGDAFVITPLTRDPENLRHLLPALSPEVMPDPGHDPVAGFRQAINMLTQAGYDRGDIIWLTGGVQRADVQDILNLLRRHSYRVSILSFGTSDGGPVRNADGSLARDRQGQLLLPRLIPDYLERIANSTQGIHLPYRTDRSDIEQLLALQPLVQDVTEDEQRFAEDQWLDTGPYLAVLLIPLLLIIARERALLSLGMIAMLSLLMPPQVMASTKSQASTSWLQQIFQNRSQQAQNAYTAQDFDTAERRASDPMMRGMALYRQGRFEEAALEFARLDTPDAHYNRGNSLAYAGDIEQAILAYKEALSLRPDWSEAYDNKTLLEQLQSEQGNEGGDSPQNGDQTHEDLANDGDEADQQPEESEQESEADDSDSTDGSQDQTTESQSSDEQQEQEPREQDPVEQRQDDTGELIDEQALPDFDDLSEEEREQLEQLMRRLQDDPAWLLRNRLRMEAERRRFQSGRSSPNMR